MKKTSNFFQNITLTKKGRAAPTFENPESVGVNADALLGFGDMLKLDLTVNQCEKRIVRADADIVAGVNARAALSDNNVAGGHSLTVCLLDAETLRLAVTAVLRRTYALFMSEKLQTEFQHFSNLR